MHLTNLFAFFIQGWSERGHWVDGEVCGQKHSQATSTEGHHVRSCWHLWYIFWTTSFSSRTFHVNLELITLLSPRVCCDFEQFEFLLLGVHYQPNDRFYHQASYEMCFEWTSACSTFSRLFLPHVSAAAPVTGASWGCLDKNISLTHHMKYCIMWFLSSVSD